MSDINTNSQRNLLMSPLLKNIHLCRDMPSQSVIFNILESVFYQEIKHRLGIFKRVWKMSQSVDFHLSLYNLCNLRNLWICVLLPPWIDDDLWPKLCLNLHHFDKIYLHHFDIPAPFWHFKPTTILTLMHCFDIPASFIHWFSWEFWED